MDKLLKSVALGQIRKNDITLMFEENVEDEDYTDEEPRVIMS